MQIQDTKAKQALESVVADFVSHRRIFTAAHVTVEVRKRKTAAGTLPHRGVLAPAVRALFQGGGMPGYMRVPVPGSVFAYCPAGEATGSLDHVDLAISAEEWVPPLDPTQVEAEAEVGEVSASGYPTTIVQEAASPGGTRGEPKVLDVKYLRAVEDGTRVARKWRSGRFVEVPREMMRNMGFEKGDLISIVPCEDGVEASLVKGDFSEQTANVQNSRLVLRLSRRVLEPLGFTTESKVLFTYREDEDGGGMLDISQ